MLFLCEQALIEETLEKNNAIILQGRRFSGKMHVLCGLAEQCSKFDILYFPSSEIFDENLIGKMLRECTHSLFLFDSNSLSEYAYQEVAHSIEYLRNNNNKLVVAVNSKDLFLSDN